MLNCLVFAANISSLHHIAYNLLLDKRAERDLPAKQNLKEAIKTIVVADAVMGLDNILAIAGAAKGNYVLVILGLLISVPIIVWGSKIILTFIERYPIIIYFGSGVLAFTAVRMIIDEPLLSSYFDQNTVLKWILGIVIIGGVLLVGKVRNKEAAKQL